MTSAPAPPDAFQACQERVLEVLRQLALELGGSRALRAVAPTASLEREVGLGSLEGVELLLRLESALDRELGDRFMPMDSAAEIARALLAGASGEPLRLPERASSLPAAPRAATAAATLDQALVQAVLADPDRPHVYLRDEDGREETIT